MRDLPICKTGLSVSVAQILLVLTGNHDLSDIFNVYKDSPCFGGKISEYLLEVTT